MDTDKQDTAEIVSEPSNPPAPLREPTTEIATTMMELVWFAPTGSVASREYYETARSIMFGSKPTTSYKHSVNALLVLAGIIIAALATVAAVAIAG